MSLRDREELRRYKAAWYQANRERIAAERAATRSWLNQIKLDRGCEHVLGDGSMCGYRDHAVALEFDHRDPSTKRFNISQRVACRPEVLLAEIAKCDVICSNHHQIRSLTKGHLFRGVAA